MKALRKSLFVLLYLFALIGLATCIGYIAIKLRLTDVKGVVDTENRYLKVSEKKAWQTSDEWATLEKAIKSDAEAINKAARESGVPSRLIAAQLVVEQLRLYNSDREIYKEIFKPLQILGVQSQFSWGVMGTKQDTAIQIENNLKNSASPFYLGKDQEHILDFMTKDPDSERFDRLTNEKDHYYSYLYTGLYIKEIIAQWQKAGFPIENRPEILSTLYNIGFEHSKPNAHPAVGGAEIEISAETYSFGELAYAFYVSEKLIADFPR